MGLSLQHLTGLWLLAGALPVVLLYVLKARRRRVRVPSTWLWSAAQQDLTARTPFKRLRRELPLVLELLALAALALAVSAPACRGRAVAGNHVAIVLDVSASMSARDEVEGRTRLEAARAAARRIAAGLAFDADAMLVAAGSDARVLFPLGRDRDGLLRAIDRAAAQDTEGDPAAAIALAVDRLRSLSGDSRVFLVSDAAAGRVETLRAGAIPLQLVRVGHPQDNTGIVRMDVRTARQDQQGEVVQAFALLAHHGERAREVFVTVRHEGATSVLASRRVRLEPNAREPVTLTYPFAAAEAGQGVVIEIDPRDSLPVDDVAYGRVPPGMQLPVVLAAHGESPWIRRALEADPAVALSTAEPAALRGLPQGALVVFDGACPDPLPPDHDVVVFAPPAGRCAGVTVGAPVEAPEITSYVHTDPRFRFLTMDGVHLAHATPLDLGARATELLRAGAHVLFADDSTPDRAVTVVGLDVGESDWPLRASFVLFIRNVEEVARAHRARAVAGGGRTGVPLRVAVPAGVREVNLRGPWGAARVGVTAGTAVVGETSRAGLYHLTWRDGSTTAAVNLLADAESNLRAPLIRVEGTPTVTDLRALVRPHQDLAPWAALVAALALVGNLVWLTRRERAPSRAVRPVAPSPPRGAR